MSNNFKNPFDIDEQDTIISLQQGSSYTQSISNLQQPAKPMSFSNLQDSIPDNEAAALNNEQMFGLLNPQIHQESSNSVNEEAQDPPLLEDIGLNVQMIKNRVINILTLGEVNRELVQQPDLSGPIIISFFLGVLLLLGGKNHFSDILTEFTIGNVVMCCLFNFMANETFVSLYSVMSFLGYSLLPMLILATFGIIFSLNNSFGVLTSLVLAIWSSYTAGIMISIVINRIERKLLVMYPLFLFYLSFALIIIF